MSHTVLITGGLGQLGYYVYQELKEDYKIVIIDNCTNNKVESIPDAEIIIGDVQDPKILSKLREIDFIIHCAAQISVLKSTSNPIFDAENNIMGTINLLEFAKKRQIKNFVYVSSAATYGDPQFLPITELHPRAPLSPYGLSKLTGEKYTLLYNRLYELKSTVIIPFNIYSPLQTAQDPYAGVIYKFINALKQGKPITIYGSGEQTRDFVHAEDVAWGIRLAMEKADANGEVFNIASGKPTDINTLAEILIKTSGQSTEIVHLPEVKGEIKESYASIEKAQKILGYKPRTTLKEGIKKVFDELAVS
ncbi:MAG: NAD-dependent epimerase/dehydratase family protein [Candidatus Heimdallarchaeaceae archaeon]